MEPARHLKPISSILRNLVVPEVGEDDLSL